MPKRGAAPSEHNYTYFIRMGDDGPIKIGMSHDPWERLLDLQTASPYRLKILLVIRGAWWEGLLHERLSHLALMGEWFRSDPELVAFIDRLALRADTHLARTIEPSADSGSRRRRNRNMPPRARLDEVSHDFLTTEELERMLAGEDVGPWKPLSPIARAEDLMHCESPSARPGDAS